MAFRKDNKIKSNFSSIRISLASPEEIKENSHGEVLRHETVSYRTYKPERDGLYCERIFGPVKDYECHCGKYKGNKYKGITCDRCGVEVTQKMVRRERMGHIQLNVPVVHVWYSRSNPNKIGHLLGLSSKVLNSIIYYQAYVVLQPGIFSCPDDMDPESDEAKEAGYVTHYQIISNPEYDMIMDRIYREQPENQKLDNSDPNKFIAKSGGEALLDMLRNLDLDALSDELRHKAQTETSQQRKQEALKRLPTVEAFRASKDINKPEWMIMQVIPVIPPDLRPLMPLDGGRFASSDLNELYIKVITRNNRLARFFEQESPDVIVRQEKRMLQEAVDALFDNSNKSSAITSDNGRPFKSLSDSIKGKQGRFRQNLLGKRVDYSARSVIVVGPELKMNECGLPKDMAAELYKPFIMRKLIERGIVKTEKSAKRIVDRRDPIIWEIVENVIKGHPVMLNRAPTLHRLGIQSYQPKLIEGKAIQLSPLSCTAFNADFDGDQMAVHLPLSNEAIAEAQLLMLASHNILNPASGEPITVPSQDMVLGLYYITKLRTGSKGEGLTFYGAEEAFIAYDCGQVDLHAPIKVYVDTVNEKGEHIKEMTETSVGRLMFNQRVPADVGYINQLVSKSSLKKIIKLVLKVCGVARTAQFLDDVKSLGYYMSFKGGLSFNIEDVIVPSDKKDIIGDAQGEADEIIMANQMGQINAEKRYNELVDLWTKTTDKLTNRVMEEFKNDNQGFNSIYMMLDSGARGSTNQIRQLAGMRGLMAKPQKSGSGGGSVIENPIISNFLEGLSVLEYFISTHGARKGLTDTALKTADAGYLTRRLVDVSQDSIITEEDCGTLRGLEATEIVDSNDNVIASLYKRIVGRVALNDVIHPVTGKVIVKAGEEIREQQAEEIENSPIKSVEIRSALTCDAKRGLCAKCYGRNLATNRLVEKGEVVGVIAAQSIGEPGTQLTLRTFHAGGVADSEKINKSIKSKLEGELEFTYLTTLNPPKSSGDVKGKIVISRTAEMRIVDPETRTLLKQYDIPYGSHLYFEPGDKVKPSDVLVDWDPFNTVLIADVSGKIVYENLKEGATYKVDIDAASGYRDCYVIEGKDKKVIPTLKIVDKAGEVLRSFSLPVNCRLSVMPESKDMSIEAGEELYKIPRTFSSAGDITGGLPRVQQLVEARDPSNPAILSEVDGEVTFGKITRNQQVLTVTTNLGEVRKYSIPIKSHILVQDKDMVRAGTPLTEGAVKPSDILAIMGPTALQEYIVNEIQSVYRKQNVEINDKHFEVIVRQMMRKAMILDPGDTMFLDGDIIDKSDIQEENDALWGKQVILDAGDSDKYRAGRILTAPEVRDENSSLSRRDLKTMTVRDTIPATSRQVLQGITRASLRSKGFMSAASFQETTKVLTDAAINGRTDYLLGLKENVICGHLIPAGTGLADWRKMTVMPREDYERLEAERKATGHDVAYAHDDASEGTREE